MTWNSPGESSWDGDRGEAVAPAVSLAPIGVAQLLRAVRSALQGSFSGVFVEGEIADIKPSAAGHIYLTIKDRREEASLSCTLFRRVAEQLTFSPRQGDVVQISGGMNVYAPRGQMNLNVEAMRLAGEGDLFAQFLRLKAKLQAEGLFDEARKKPVPRYPERIGIITSPGAAGEADAIRTIRAAAPFMPITRYSASVQGEQALPELIDALARANQDRRADVLLLVRGGGSIGDLWTYNLEPLARAIAASEIPVIAGVGHESDTTIADLVADYRAATPTAAAAYATRFWSQAPELVLDVEKRLKRAVRNQMQNAQMRLDAADHLGALASQKVAGERSRLSLCGNMPREFAHFVEQLGSRLVSDERQLGQSARSLLQSTRQRADRLCSALTAAAPRLDVQHQKTALCAERLERAAAQTLRSATLRLDALSARLLGVSVEKTLSRGFAIALDDAGRVMRDAMQYKPGTLMTVRLAHGSLKSRVTEVADEEFELRPVPSSEQNANH